MDLYISATSPYARKVRIALIELELEHCVRMIPVNPLEDPPELHARNPLGKIPALQLPDGRVIYDSPVLCAYFNALSERFMLIPAEPSARFDALTREACADGMMDAAVAVVMERRRPAEQQSAQWLLRWQNAIHRSAAYFNHKMATVQGRFDIGDIALATAMDYVDFRLSALGLLNDHTDLRSWRGTLADRPSLIRTHPDVPIAPRI
jgi:glutathione S-transferase